MSRWRVRRGDSGVSSIEWALLTPLIIAVILCVIQFAMIYHAQHVALAAAQTGAREARQAPVGDGWAATGENAALNAVEVLGPNLLTNVQATAEGDGDYVRGVTVTGQAKVVIPGFHFQVTKKAEGPVECFRPDVDEAKNCIDEQAEAG